MRTLRWVSVSILGTCAVTLLAAVVLSVPALVDEGPELADLLLVVVLLSTVSWTVLALALYLVVLAAAAHDQTPHGARLIAFTASPIIGIATWVVAEHNYGATPGVFFAVLTAAGVALVVPTPPGYASRWSAVWRTAVATAIVTPLVALATGAVFWFLVIGYVV